AAPATASTAAAVSETIDSTDTTDTTDTTSTTEFVPETTEPKLPIPEGQLVAVPQQNREDPAKGQFQVQVVNGTRDRFEVASVQFVWAGYTTPATPRDTTVVGGQTIDFPVAFPGAVCVGDGLIDSMPSLDTAVVLLGLDDGSVREMPVVDRWHLARRLYLEDCQRQHIDASVTIEWADLHREDWEGRPVTAGVLRLTRGTSTDTITIDAISGTVPYSFETVGTDEGEPVAVLPEGTTTIDVAIRFTESRCDPHALAEVKQPHKFVAQVDLGDGVLQPFVVVPDEADWIPMRRTADEACVVTGQVVFVGEETPTASSAP
ncbi:MAG: hypothetical protein NTZ21_15675, partial [Actinobacteria bacterium]|nr:hypothetical protein [Actinomycetota bacterium]